jgi:hypothetical protein
MSRRKGGKERQIRRSFHSHVQFPRTSIQKLRLPTYVFAIELCELGANGGAL